MPLPPHQHPLDWLVIPELTGQSSTGFIAYTKGGWVCRLCSTEKLASVEDHCRTQEHTINHRRLEERRRELAALVELQEDVIRQQRHEERLLQEQQKQQRAKEAYLEVSRERQLAKENEATQDKVRSTERRSHLQANKEMRLAQAHRNSWRDKKQVEEFKSDGNSSSSASARVRRLRAQRLASQNNASKEAEGAGAAGVEEDPQEKLRQKKLKEKEEKRLKMLEITLKHREQQRLEELQAEKEAMARKKTDQESVQNELSDCFGCWSSTLWEDSTGILCGGTIQEEESIDPSEDTDFSKKFFPSVIFQTV
jgi:hypothetical protein